MASSAAVSAEEPLSAEQVYDSIGPAYEAAYESVPEQLASIKWLLSKLEAANINGARLLDIGCGTGRPVCWALATAGHDVLGIDISIAMVEAARERVPAARFEQVDMRDFIASAAEEYYDAVTVYFSMIAGVTQEEIRQLIAGVHRLIRPGGFFVFASVPVPADKLQIKFMGRPVQVSNLGPQEAVEWIKKVGFQVEHEEVTKFTPKGVEADICTREEVWEELHLFVYSKKPAL
jgi:cyclopropane fatty-acyl-phospholipid synthase-like methyltransferase